jgi:hypothetical protein
MRVPSARSGLIWPATLAALVLALPLGLAVAGGSRGLAAVRSAGVVQSPAAPGRQAALPGGVRQACPTPTGPGQMACLVLIRTNLRGGVRPGNVGPDVYDPADLRSAYKLAAASASRGRGETVAVVDAYNDPDARADLAVYRRQWGLPPCDRATGAGCVTVVNQNGAARPLPPADPTGGWEVEESLDMEMVAAICPRCHILLVEARSSDTTDLGTAEDSAVRLGAKFVNDSWGGSGNVSLDHYFNHPGVAITVAAGDDGYGTSYPASTQFVTSVGGTTLVPAPRTARGWRETAWSLGQMFFSYEGTGAGCSADPDADAKPAWQTVDDNAARGCLTRTDNDVSAVADPNTPVWIYDSYPEFGIDLGWNPVGGTSVASPIVAAVYALAGPPRLGTYPASYLYQRGHAAHLYPVHRGRDGFCRPAYLCDAAYDYPGTSYNAPTGWGTPDGTAAFTDTATGDTITVVDPGTQDTSAGSQLRLPVSAVDSASGRHLTFSAAGLPAGLAISPVTGLISGRLAGAGTGKVTVTAADGTGATGSVSFDIVAAPSLRAAYRRVSGPVTLYLNYTGTDTVCLYDAGNGTANGTKIELWRCDDSAAERWTYLPDAAPDGSGTLIIHGKCATIVHVAGDGRRLRLEPCTGAPSQSWSLQYGAAWLYNPASAVCMHDPRASSRDGTQVGVASCEFPLGEEFILPPGPVLSGVGGRCLTDPGNISRPGTRLTAEPCDARPAQLWSIFSDAEQGARHYAQHNGLCVHASGNPDSKPGIANGTPVLLVKCAGANSLWYPLPDGQVVSGSSGLCLDAAGGGPAAAVVVEPCYGDAGELWAEG